MAKLKVKKIGLSLGYLFALMHLTWVTLVAIFGAGITQHITGLHFITSGIATMPVTIGTTLLGVISAFVTGYVIGTVFGLIWNKLR